MTAIGEMQETRAEMEFRVYTRDGTPCPNSGYVSDFNTRRSACVHIPSTTNVYTKLCTLGYA